MILAGDVGGTKTVFAIYDASAPDRPLREQRFACADYDGFEAMLREFLLAQSPGARIEAACIGIAGIVEGGRCNATNLPWSVGEAEIARITGAPRVRLLNDLEAGANGMRFLRDDQLVVLQPGLPNAAAGHVAVIAPGTGLGEALLYWDGEVHHPMATEGGHTGFAPRDELEIELLRWLRERHGTHVSVERVLSGPGYVELYRFLRARSGEAEPEALTQALLSSDAAEAITRSALAGADAVSEQTLDRFVSILGGEAGDLALRTLPRGGVFIGGGIAPQILPALQTATFLDAFCDKGFFTDYLRGLRVSVALEARAPLIGCAHYAARMLGGADRVA